MNPSELKFRLHALVDGELDAVEEQEVRSALAEHPDCQAEIEEIKATRNLAHVAFAAPAGTVDLSGVYDGVMARIEASEQVEGVPVLRQSELQASVLQRIGGWLAALVRFERPVAAAATCAVLIIMVGGIWLSSLGPNEPDGTINDGAPGGVASTNDDKTDNEAIAKSGEPVRSTRRTDEEPEVLEAGEPGANAAQVVSFVSSEGTVRIEHNEDDPSQPVVVWHIVEESSGGDGEDDNN